jgi:hypothetical protein
VPEIKEISTRKEEKREVYQVPVHQDEDNGPAKRQALAENLPIQGTGEAGPIIGQDPISLRGIRPLLLLTDPEAHKAEHMPSKLGNAA